MEWRPCWFSYNSLELSAENLDPATPAASDAEFCSGQYGLSPLLCTLCSLLFLGLTLSRGYLNSLLRAA